MNVRLVWVTPEAEKHIAYCARVSSANPDNPEYAKLLGYLIRNKHWSPFEMAYACFEIRTSRAIAQQILRHRSFSFQEFSQRYAEAPSVVKYEARRQAETNRQSSIDDLPPDVTDDFRLMQDDVEDYTRKRYELALELGVAKESARFLLPLATETKIFVVGNVRSWIHYLELRCDEHTQLEHRVIAEEIKSYFSTLFPKTFEALGW